MENKNTNPTRACKIFWLSFLAGYLFQIVALIVVISVFKTINKEISTNGLMNNIYINLILLSAQYIAMLTTCLFISKPTSESFKKPTLLKMLLYIFIAAATFFALSPIISCINLWFVKAGLTPTSLTFDLSTKNYFIALIFLVILPATVEEILFRGAVFKNLSKQGQTFACITTTLIFSLFHTSIFQTIYPILFGFLLCVIMLCEDNIYYCMIAHAVNNFLALTTQFFGLNLFSNALWFTVLAFVLALAYIATIIAVFISIKHKTKQEKQPLTFKDKIALIVTFTVLAIVWVCASFLG